jgi:hypothetical protein
VITEIKANNSKNQKRTRNLTYFQTTKYLKWTKANQERKLIPDINIRETFLAYQNTEKNSMEITQTKNANVGLVCLDTDADWCSVSSSASFSNLWT